MLSTGSPPNGATSVPISIPRRWASWAVSRISAVVQRELERVFAEHDLTGADFDVLATLRRSGAPYHLTPGELSRSTMVTTGGMTKRLDRLEAAPG